MESTRMWPGNSEYAGEGGRNIAGDTGAGAGTARGGMDGYLQWAAKEREDSPDWTR